MPYPPRDTPTPNIPLAAINAGLTPYQAGLDDERVWVFKDKPYNEQPTVFTANNLWAQLPEAEMKDITSKMDQLYGPGKWSTMGGAGKAGIKGFFQQAVDISRAANNIGQTLYVSDAFDQLISQQISEQQQAAAAAGAGGGGGPRVTASVNLTDPGTAETLIDQALQQYLGRKASDKEVRQFRKALTKAELGDPRRADIIGTTQVTSGGFNPAAFAQQYAEGMEGAAEYQAATTFLDAFIDALGPKVEV